MSTLIGLPCGTQVESFLQSARVLSVWVSRCCFTFFWAKKLNSGVSARAWVKCVTLPPPAFWSRNRSASAVQGAAADSMWGRQKLMVSVEGECWCWQHPVCDKLKDSDQDTIRRVTWSRMLESKEAGGAVLSPVRLGSDPRLWMKLQRKDGWDHGWKAPGWRRGRTSRRHPGALEVQ